MGAVGQVGASAPRGRSVPAATESLGLEEGKQSLGQALGLVGFAQSSLREGRSSVIEG